MKISYIVLYNVQALRCLEGFFLTFFSLSLISSFHLVTFFLLGLFFNFNLNNIMGPIAGPPIFAATPLFIQTSRYLLDCV
jgi:hypothetical protein